MKDSGMERGLARLASGDRYQMGCSSPSEREGESVSRESLLARGGAEEGSRGEWGRLERRRGVTGRREEGESSSRWMHWRLGVLEEEGRSRLGRELEAAWWVPVGGRSSGSGQNVWKQDGFLDISIETHAHQRSPNFVWESAWKSMIGGRRKGGRAVRRIMQRCALFSPRKTDESGRSRGPGRESTEPGKTDGGGRGEGGKGGLAATGCEKMIDEEKTRRR